MPDFAQVYSFIGSVFDPNTRDHLQRLKKMDPIDIQTVCWNNLAYIHVLMLVQVAFNMM